jgi:hypothetical protein
MWFCTVNMTNSLFKFLFGKWTRGTIWDNLTSIVVFCWSWLPEWLGRLCSHCVSSTCILNSYCMHIIIPKIHMRVCEHLSANWIRTNLLCNSLFGQLLCQSAPLKMLTHSKRIWYLNILLNQHCFVIMHNNFSNCACELREEGALSVHLKFFLTFWNFIFLVAERPVKFRRECSREGWFAAPVALDHIEDYSVIRPKTCGRSIYFRK